MGAVGGSFLSISQLLSALLWFPGKAAHKYLETHSTYFLDIIVPLTSASLCLRVQTLSASAIPPAVTLHSHSHRKASAAWLRCLLGSGSGVLPAFLGSVLFWEEVRADSRCQPSCDPFQDLFSALIKGPTRTPYEDGLYLFDIQLPNIYPAVPPHFCYLSQCSGRLNPNLYDNGKVCVSLLGTWIGKVIVGPIAW